MIRLKLLLFYAKNCQCIARTAIAFDGAMGPQIDAKIEVQSMVQKAQRLGGI